MLGVIDPRVRFDAPALVATTDRPALVADAPGYRVYAVRWPVLSDPHAKREGVIVEGEGLLLVPKDRPTVADVVA